MRHLNSDHLRTFLAVEHAGSVTGGAARIGRSQSATSLQIRQLEEITGRPLFRRHGRGITLTPAGEQLRPVARNVIQSLDVTLAALRDEGLKGSLRIGMPDDHSRTALTAILADFAARHPEVDLEVHCASGAGFETAIESGALDLAVHEVPEPNDNHEILRKDHLIWMCSGRYAADANEILPIAVFDRDCWWRDSALDSLERAGRRYKVVFSSESTVGVRAAVRSGIAAALLSTLDDVDGLRTLPELSTQYPTYLVLQKTRDATDAVCEAMCEAIRRAFARST